jgi:cold-inducible RNA-binding protein
MNIYVGNLSFNATESEIREAFASYGEVSSCSIIVDKYTQQSKGFGFVEMSNKAEALAAIQGLNGKEIGGRSITVNEARPKEDRGGSRSGGGGGGGGGNRRW